MKTFLFPILLAALIPITARASVSEIVPALASEDLAVRFQAQADLMREASNAGRPDAEAERAAYCRELCEALSTDCPPHAAAQLVRQLQRIGGQGSVDTLRRLLQHPDAHLRDDVRQALETNPSPSAGEILLEAWKQSGDETWTIGLINSLAVRSDRRAITPLTHALRDVNPRIAAAAYTALGMIKAESAATALHRALKTTEGAAHVQNARALLDFAHMSARHGNGSLAARLSMSLTGEQESADVRTSAWIGLLTAQPEQAAERADPLSDPIVLAAAIEASTQIQSPELVDKIAGQLSTTSPETQIRILAALEARPNSEHAASVAGLLTAEDTNLANAAAKTLGIIGTLEQMPALMDAAAKNDAARQALATLPMPAVDEALRQAAASGDNARRVLAIQILGLRGGEGQAEYLQAMARDADPAIAGAAIAALKDLATVEDLDAIASMMLETESSSLARAALGTVIAISRNASDPKAAVDVLMAKLPDATASGQALIFQAFAKSGSDATLQPVVAAAESDDVERRASGLKALSTWPNPNGIEAMLNIASDESLEMKDHVLIMRGVFRLISAEKRVNVGQCEKALQAARRPDEKKMLLGVLGKSKDKSALALIEPYLADPELKEEAKLAADAVGARSKR